MKKINKILFLSFAALLLFARPVFADLGISPGDWTEPNAMPGQQIEKTFYLTRNDASADLNFTSQIAGDISQWVTIQNGNSFTIPAGEQQYPVKVTINVPQNAAKKEYKTTIRLNSSSPSKGAGQVGVSLGALINIDLTVTDKQVSNYTVQQIQIPEQQSGDYLNVILNISNQGNVEAKPTEATIDVFDKYNSTKIGSQTITDFSNVTGVAPFTVGTVSLQFPLKLPANQYWGNVNVYQSGNVLKSDHLVFQIVVSAPPAVQKQYSSSDILPLIILIAVLAVFAVIILIFFLSKMGKKPSLQNQNIQEEPDNFPDNTKS